MTSKRIIPERECQHNIVYQTELLLDGEATPISIAVPDSIVAIRDNENSSTFLLVNKEPFFTTPYPHHWVITNGNAYTVAQLLYWEQEHVICAYPLDNSPEFTVDASQILGRVIGTVYGWAVVNAMDAAGEVL